MCLALRVLFALYLCVSSHPVPYFCTHSFSCSCRVHLREQSGRVRVSAMQQRRHLPLGRGGRTRVPVSRRLQRRALRVAGGRVRVSALPSRWPVQCYTQLDLRLLLRVSARSRGAAVREQRGRLPRQELSRGTRVRRPGQRA